MKIKELEILKLNPGDILKIKLAKEPTYAQHDGIKEHLKYLFPDNKILILGPETDITIEKVEIIN